MENNGKGKSSLNFHEFRMMPAPTTGSSSNNTNVAASGTNNRVREGGGSQVREQDRYVPVANLVRTMRRIVPSHGKISEDAKEVMQECVSEFISFVTSEANDHCKKQQRKTVSADDIIFAMNKLGFDDYVEPLGRFLQRYRQVEGGRSSIRGDPVVQNSLRRSAMAMVAAQPQNLNINHMGMVGPSFVAPENRFLANTVSNSAGMSQSLEPTGQGQGQRQRQNHREGEGKSFDPLGDFGKGLRKFY